MTLLPSRSAASLSAARRTGLTLALASALALAFHLLAVTTGN